MKIALLAITILLFPFIVFAQQQVDMQIMQKIKDEEAKNSQVGIMAHYLTDVCGPRLTNSPGYRRAVTWAVKTLKQWGLQNAAPEPWGEFGKGWSTEESYLAIKEPYYQPLIAYPAAWTKSTNGLVSAKVLLLEKLDSASVDKLGTDLKGSIVMLKSTVPISRTPFIADARRYEESELNKLPDEHIVSSKVHHDGKRMVNSRYAIQRYLEAKGATAILAAPLRGNDGTVLVTGYLSYHKAYEPTLPRMIVSRESYFGLQRLLLSGQSVSVEMKVQNTWYTDDLTGYNVVAEIPGTDKKLKSQVVMLGAHLDSWHGGTGATDNAAGCIATMEAVRILKAIGVRPKRTIRIALWGGEEQYVLGSFGYVKQHFGDPRDMKLTPQQKKVSVYFNLDGGTGKIRGIYLQNNEKVRDIFSVWLQPFAAMGATGITSSNFGGSDHLSFDAVGIPAFQFIQDPMEYVKRTHHTNMDVYDYLSTEDLKQAATVIAAFVYNAAMREELLPRKPLPKPEPFLFENGLAK
jgi:carboxypeptidase Q